MDTNKDHNNWLTVGEVVRLIKDPITLYTDHIVNKFHEELSSRLPSGRCTNRGACQKKRKHQELCITCKRWYDELVKCHKNKDRRNIKWCENCDPSKWPTDPWEVSKFFMPDISRNTITINDPESTDLSSLLNVLAWVEDAVFSPERRLNRDLVVNFRSAVRNMWAHAPHQELSKADLKTAFYIANQLLCDLNEVFDCNKVKNCLEDIKYLQKNGLTNVTEDKLKTLNLLAVELGANVRTLEKRVETLEVFGNNKGDDGLKSCIPDKLPIFIGRETEREEIIFSIVEKGSGIVSIVGGPGFGKSSLAVQVSHDLRDQHDFVVIFSSLSNSSTFSDVIQRLCNDVGVNPGDDPESSLTFPFKSSEKKVVLVMDNIEQLLEDGLKSQFIELVLTLRKNSREHLQILTTTRVEFYLDQTTQNHHIFQLDEKSSVELLKRCYPYEKVPDACLSELANLCGCVPLALCIAGTLFPYLDDASELIEWLKENPMEVLQDSSARCVRKAIEFSFQMLSHEDQKAFVRLSVFSGNFEGKSVEEVIERTRSKTAQFLQNLVARSLLQRNSDKRFMIHSLIRRFLADCDQYQNEKTIGQELMVRHFLKKCHSLTMNSYSEYNGFATAREKLRKDAHNVEETLKICSQHQNDLKPNILEILTSSDIYNVSAWFFYDFSWDVLSAKILRNFFESCIKISENKNEPAIQVAFQWVVAVQEGHKSSWRSCEYDSRMKQIEEMLCKLKEIRKNDSFLLMYYYAFYVCYGPKAENPLSDLPEDDFARLSDIEALGPMKKVEEVYVLISCAHLHKKHANKIYSTDKENSEKYRTRAESCYKRALLEAKKLFGDHGLTCTLQKQLGDFYLTSKNYEAALTNYSEASETYKKLKLDSSERFVFLVKNHGACLSYLGRFEEALEKLEEGRDIADKLADNHTVCRARVNYELAQTYSKWKPDCQEAADYAKRAITMEDLLHSDAVAEMQNIIEQTDQNIAWKALCTRFSHSLVLYQKSHSFAALPRSISGTSPTPVKIPYARAFHEVIFILLMWLFYKLITYIIS